MRLRPSNRLPPPVARKVEVESCRWLAAGSADAPGNAPANPSLHRRSTRLEVESLWEEVGGDGEGGSGLGRSGLGARPNRTPYTSWRNNSAGRDARKLSEPAAAAEEDEEEEMEE